MSKTISSRTERSSRREKQILDSAKECFSRIGFHATSMAQIATRARMSVGQIYRHFKNKEALIEGIVKEDVSRQMAWMDTPGVSPVAELTTISSRKRSSKVDAQRRHLALMLEIVAEAARNPKVLNILLAGQHKGHAALIDRIKADLPGAWSKDEIDVRLRLVSFIRTGVIMQTMLDGRAPASLLTKRSVSVCRQLLSPKGIVS